MDQVSARGIRRKSHVGLPVDERRVDVYRYLAVFTPEQAASTKQKLSTDQQIYELALRKRGITNEILRIMQESAVDCLLNLAQAPEGAPRCFSYGDDTAGLAYKPTIKQDFVYQATGETVTVKREFALGGVSGDGRVYLIDPKRKAVYAVDAAGTPEGKRTPVTPRPKIKSKVWLDLEGRKFYDYEYTKEGGDQPPLGQFNEAGDIL